MAQVRKHERVLAGLLKAVHSQQSSWLAEIQSAHILADCEARGPLWEAAKVGLSLRLFGAPTESTGF